MMISFEVEYRYYQHNSGAADNGEYNAVRKTKTEAEAIALAQRINNAAAIQKQDYSEDDLVAASDRAAATYLADEMLPYSGYFISARAVRVNREPLA